MKSFARPGFHRNSLGYVRYYDFIRPGTVLRYFSHFLTGSLPFRLPLQFWFSCSFTEPKQGSCRLYAVRCVPGCQVSGTLCLSRSLPFRFYHSKGYFRHLNDGLLALNSPALTIRSLAFQRNCSWQFTTSGRKRGITVLCTTRIMKTCL